MMSFADSIAPRGEALRGAIRWLGRQGRLTLALVEEASQRYDLSPADEDFLVRQFLHHEGIHQSDAA